VAGGQTLEELQLPELLRELYDYVGAGHHLEPESVHHGKMIQNGIQGAVVDYNITSTINTSDCMYLQSAILDVHKDMEAKISEVLVQLNSITNTP
jgi:hypothetical protein